MLRSLRCGRVGVGATRAARAWTEEVRGCRIADGQGRVGSPPPTWRPAPRSCRGALSLASLMLVAQVTGLSPLPAPLGVAFAETVLPPGTAGPHGLLWIGLGLHVVYVGSATVGYLAVAR